VLRARLALKASRPEQARTLVKEGPVEHVGLALLRGQLAARSNDPAAAARELRIALRLDPTNREALHGLALALKQLGDAEAGANVQKQAEDWRHVTSLLQEAKTFNMRNDKSLLKRLGEACEAVCQRDVARAWYRLALDQDPLDGAVQKSLYRLKS
jgi:hypothetical protein